MRVPAAPWPGQYIVSQNIKIRRSSYGKNWPKQGTDARQLTRKSMKSYLYLMPS